MQRSFLLLLVVLAGAWAVNTTIPLKLMGGFTPMKYQCVGRVSDIWADVLFLIESSDMITKSGFRQVIAFITATTKKMTIGQDEKQTRVGFITYGEEAKLIYDLDHWRSTEKLSDLVQKIPYVKSSGTNIAAAIALANKVFNSPTHRPNVPKVMVIVANGLKKGSQNPIPVATAFKDFGGIIITIEYTQYDNIEVPILKKIASEGYNIRSNDEDFSVRTLTNMLLQDHYIPFRVNNPEFGCFVTAKIPSMWRDAAEMCRAVEEGKLVKVENEEKAAFIMKCEYSNRRKPRIKVHVSVVEPKKEAWIGLRYYGNKFQWTDGTKADEDDHTTQIFFQLNADDFNLWPEDIKELNGPHCVSMYQDQKDKKYYWRAGKCLEDMRYVCEVQPCSASNYCSEPVAGVPSLQHSTNHAQDS
ncbi:von Willebrand factor type A domain protein [Necator americanus]|uniref:von Willebrand factor type A domain protein n=1 Tax=Necator americanus TaxID=51031 RepID=W2SGH1_NECAM|nr:von Willebrand factor type A domain protein [Necator americanus]ETN68724.1 von Willebrand factor type A domain protein [Necator americanus]